MKKAKKVINDPKNVVPELLEGLVLAYHGQIRKLEGLTGWWTLPSPARWGC